MDDSLKETAVAEQDSGAPAPNRGPAGGPPAPEPSTPDRPAEGGPPAAEEAAKGGADEAAAEPREPRGNAFLAAFLAWLFPGAGHLYVGRRGRGVLFLVLVLASLVVGVLLEGKLWHIVPGQPMSVLGTLGCAGLGIPYLVLRFVVGYEGDLLSKGFEYGAAFIVTAGLMNLLLVLDAWDIARGVKE